MPAIYQQIKALRLGPRKNFLPDLYFHVLKVSWARFFVGIILFFFLINTGFALLYSLDQNGVANIKDNSFFELFVFSCQTFSTVGYGYFMPVSTYSHIIAVFENVTGIIFTAIMTGLTFAKFSRPKPSIIFTEKAIITDYNGIPTLMFRIGNDRDTSIVDAKLTLVTLRQEKTPEGHTMQRFVNLKLERDQSPFFVLTWTVMHKLDETSPFHNYTEERFQQEKINLFVSLIGYDEIFSETVHSAQVYLPGQIKFAKKFVDVISVGPDGTRILDFKNFNKIEN